MNTKFDVTKLPVIAVRAGQQKTTVKMDALKESGLAFAGAYGIREGDVITFLDDYTDIDCQSVVVNPNAPNPGKAIYVPVLRNNKESWLSIGSIRRRGRDMKTSCQWVQNMVDNFTSDAERIEYLQGKTIKATGSVEMETQKFANNIMVDGEFVVRQFPIIEEVTAA